MRKNIFVLGLDRFNLARLQSLPRAPQYAFQELLTRAQVKEIDHRSFEELIDAAEDRLAAFEGPVDAIVGYWDFPVSDMLPLLCRRHGLPGPSLESVVKCEHKYWSRLEQSRSIPRCVPRFTNVDPFDEQAAERIDLEYPFWIKPVRAAGSHLGFRIRDSRDLREAIAVIRRNIRHLGEPFNHVLSHVEMTPDVAGVDGNFCVAEAIAAGHQCTLEGYVFNGDVQVYGVVDSFRAPNRSTFTRYQYPSQLPERVKQRMRECTKRFIEHIGFDNSPFNIEFFYDKPRDKLWMLEINTRVSQSHANLFEKVDGASHFQVMIDIALGERPDPPRREGKFACAAKFFFRAYQDAILTRVPDEADLKRIRDAIPDTLVELHVREGMRLSELTYQDSYSYELGYAFIGARSPRELLRKYRQCKEMLPFEFSEPGKARPIQAMG